MNQPGGKSFEALLDEAVAFLERRQRVTLRGLQRQLGVDEACAADICDELVLALRVARLEESGRILVHQSGPEPTPAAPPSTPAAVGERRQLTVMFCDLVGSTALSSRMDPEQFGQLLRAYQKVGEEAVHPFAGHIAQYLGDGILVYFGYPRAHEDDAERAVLAALAMVDRMGELNRARVEAGEPEVAVRIGLHTGLVVVDAVGTGTTREHLALGEVPNIAAKVQSLGQANSILISAATRQLVSGRFELRAEGPRDLAGKPVEVYEVLGRRRDDAPASPRVAMVGRDADMARLTTLLRRSAEGEGRVAYVRGEAGIGKSRVVAELRHLAVAEGFDVHAYYASPHFTQTALHPVAERLRRGLALDGADDPLARIRDYLAATDLASDDAVELTATLLSVGEVSEAGTQNLVGRMQELVVEWLVRNARRQPTLLVWEDLHWADPSTVELLGTLIERCSDGRVLIVLTFRDGFQPPWELDEPAEVVALTRLGRRDSRKLVEALAAESDLPAETLDEVLAKTDGIPLYAEELTRSMVDARTSQTSVPATLQDSLMARLDRLGPAKDVAQLGATIGREFTHALIAAVADLPPGQLEGALERLVGSGLVFRYGDGAARFYRFKHALVQDAAYEAILRGLRPPIHRRIAEALHAGFPHVVETQPELLAHHLSLAGEASRAIRCWLRAGERAAERSAMVEAVAHFDRGLEQLDGVGDARLRKRLELDVQVPRAGALKATRGFAHPSTGAAFDRARDLCHELGATEVLIPILSGIYTFHLIRSDHDGAGAAAAELLAEARRQNDETSEMLGWRADGAVKLHVGHPTEALESLRRGIALYDVERHKALAYRYGTDHKETSLCFVGLAHYLLGDIDSSYAAFEEAVAHAEQLEHAHSIAQALAFYCLVLSMNRDRDGLATHAPRLHELSTREHAFPYMASIAAFWVANADALTAPTEAAIAAMHDASRQWLTTGGATYQPYLLTVIAETCLAVGAERGLPFIEDARARIEATNERFSEPEAHRVEGDLRRALGDDAAAEACYRRAMECAEARGMRTWRRRALIHLGEMWRAAGRHDEARALLAPVHEGFDQGLTSVDHIRATKLLAG